MADNVKVLIPTALRPQAENHESVELAGGSVGEVLARLRDRFPALGQRLYRDDKELNRFINIYLNDENIRFLQNLVTPVEDGDELTILPAIAGGTFR
ncbi:MAG: MoaD/ThiS family protein [Armatimonadetes bacterium]|nr:MoaD/ThiS family protein [Armatimonadota bacterium]